MLKYIRDGVMIANFLAVGFLGYMYIQDKTANEKNNVYVVDVKKLRLDKMKKIQDEIKNNAISSSEEAERSLADHNAKIDKIIEDTAKINNVVIYAKGAIYSRFTVDLTEQIAKKMAGR